MQGRYAATLPHARKAGIEGLQTIAAAIRSNPTAGQPRKLMKFLGGLYDGEAHPFDMSELRGLDLNLQEACIAVLNYDRFAERGILRWGVVSEAEMRAWTSRIS